MAVGSDTTTRTRQAAQLKRQRDQLEEFASVVSHDLRSPLEVARGRLELHEATGDAAHLGAVDDALGRMSDLIDDLLTLAREGSPIDERDETTLATVARRAWDTVDTPRAVLEVTLDAETTVDADASRLQQLFENLFRNSVEHGSTAPRSHALGDSVEHGSTSSLPPAGDSVEHGSTSDRSRTDETVGPGSVDVSDGDGVTVRLTGLRNDRGFAIEDDGPGIDPADREHVFDRGFTTDDDGTGFGLAIVQRVVDAHGWGIRVAEGTDGGARFEIRVDP
jgi:signal transduction histidine kinase